MDYDEKDFQNQNLQLAGEAKSKFQPVLQPYALPKFDFDDMLNPHLRFDSSVGTEGFLGNEDSNWIEDFSRGTSGVVFSSGANESCAISRHTNVWSEATSTESVEMLFGQDEVIVRENSIMEAVDTTPDEAYMRSAFDGWKGVWEKAWRACVVRAQKLHLATPETPLQRAGRIETPSASHTSSKDSATNPMIPLSTPLWSLSTSLHSSSIQRGSVAGVAKSKFPPVLQPYALPKFDFDDMLNPHLRFDSSVGTEVFLGSQDSNWIEDFSRGTSGVVFSSGANESCAISRHTNVWSEATSTESVEMLFGQDEVIVRENSIKESDTCDVLGCTMEEPDQTYNEKSVSNEETVNLQTNPSVNDTTGESSVLEIDEQVTVKHDSPEEPSVDTADNEQIGTEMTDRFLDQTEEANAQSRMENDCSSELNIQKTLLPETFNEENDISDQIQSSFKRNDLTIDAQSVLVEALHSDSHIDSAAQVENVEAENIGETTKPDLKEVVGEDVSGSQCQDLFVSSSHTSSTVETSLELAGDLTTLTSSVSMEKLESLSHQHMEVFASANESTFQTETYTEMHLVETSQSVYISRVDEVVESTIGGVSKETNDNNEGSAHAANLMQSVDVTVDAYDRDQDAKSSQILSETVVSKSAGYVSGSSASNLAESKSQTDIIPRDKSDITKTSSDANEQDAFPETEKISSGEPENDQTVEDSKDTEDTQQSMLLVEDTQQNITKTSSDANEQDAFPETEKISSGEPENDQTVEDSKDTEDTQQSTLLVEDTQQNIAKTSSDANEQDTSPETEKISSGEPENDQTVEHSKYTEDTQQNDILSVSSTRVRHAKNYDDKDFQNQNLHLAAQGNSKFPHLRFGSLVGNEVFLGFEGNEENFSRGSSGIVFGSGANESRHNNVWSEATSSDSVEMILNSVGLVREITVRESTMEQIEPGKIEETTNLQANLSVDNTYFADEAADTADHDKIGTKTTANAQTRMDVSSTRDVIQSVSPTRVSHKPSSWKRSYGSSYPTEFKEEGADSEEEEQETGSSDHISDVDSVEDYKDYNARPRRSRVLDILPIDSRIQLTLCHSDILPLIIAKACLGRRRYDLVMETDPTDGLRISDSNRQMFVFWKVASPSRVFITLRETKEAFRTAMGFIRSQGDHQLCWVYSLLDLISSTRVLHGLDDKFEALCPRYICENVNPHMYEAEPHIYEGESHRCYAFNMEDGLMYIHDHGVPKEDPKNKIFDCCERREMVSNEDTVQISDVFKYDTLEQALRRLQTHPVAAGLVCFTGYDKPDTIYRGPLKKGAKYLGEHSVVMIECREVEGEMVVICKTSKGGRSNVGFITVSLEVMLLSAGSTRKEGADDIWRDEPEHLLSDFVSVDMPWDHSKAKIPMESDDHKEFNKKFKLLGDYDRGRRLGLREIQSTVESDTCDVLGCTMDQREPGQIYNEKSDWNEQTANLQANPSVNDTPGESSVLEIDDAGTVKHDSPEESQQQMEVFASANESTFQTKTHNTPSMSLLPSPAKLMAEEASILSASDQGNEAFRPNDSRFLGHGTPASILKGEGSAVSSGSVLVAVREAAKKRVEGSAVSSGSVSATGNGPKSADLAKNNATVIEPQVGSKSSITRTTNIKEGSNVEVFSVLEGVITEKKKKDEDTVTVHFPAQGDTLTIKAWNLRPSLEFSSSSGGNISSTHEGDTCRTIVDDPELAKLLVPSTSTSQDTTTGSKKKGKVAPTPSAVSLAKNMEEDKALAESSSKATADGTEPRRSNRRIQTNF